MDAASDLVLLGRVTVSLVVVVALALIVARMARRATVPRGGVGLRVIDRVGLSREASLAVVEVGRTALVVGVTAQSVCLLTTLDAAALREDALVSEPPTTTTPMAGRQESYRSLHQLMEALRDRTARR
jgi:flagellar biogenesis protein FliO